MSEIRSLLSASGSLRRAGRPFVLATVVGVRGSSYRRPGARMILADDAVQAGSVSAGCLEADLVRRGWWRTAQQDAAVVTYDSTTPDDELGWGLGLGCNGVVELLLERVTSDGLDPLAWHRRWLGDEQAGALVTVVRSERRGVAVATRLALGADGSVDSSVGPGATRDWLVDQARLALDEGATRAVVSPDGTLGALVEAIVPPPSLFVFGTHPDAVAVARQGLALGWRVVVAADQARWETRQRFADMDVTVLRDPAAITAAVDACARPVAVVMSHDFDRDRLVLGSLLGSSARYIGVLGPRRRTEQLLTTPDAAGRASGLDGLERLHAPAGLHLGAETPAEIALAIVAEAQSVLSGTSGCALRDRVGPIHGTSGPVARPAQGMAAE